MGHHRAGDIAKIAGFGTPLESVKFVCSRCSRRDVIVKTMFVDHDRPPKLRVWTTIPFKP